MFIDGFGISNYRSFGSGVQLIGPLSKINILIGANNSGKSNILSFLSGHFKGAVEAAQVGGSYAKIGGLDLHIGIVGEKSLFAIGLAVGSSAWLEWRESLVKNLKDRRRENVIAKWDKLMTKMSAPNEIAWFRYEGAWNRLMPYSNFVEGCVGMIQGGDWEGLWQGLTNQSGGDLRQHWIPQVLQTISPVNLPIPVITAIPAIRRIEGKGAEDDYSGLGIVDRLARLQNPGVNEQTHKKNFLAINEFVRSVVGNQSATLEIPYQRDTILVHMDGKTLPLSSLGTGIHEVVIIAAAATILRKQVLCIEEPEIHLHPLLQRKLLSYLQEKTDNQYFVSTHSAHLLDAPEARIFHVRLEDGKSVVRSVGSARDKSEICVDLGYRPSDLLQTNCIIWVEGPSDRIYINHWLAAEDPHLKEGIHYSVMFYGGRLLSHLSANDPEVTEFISLRRLNRYIAVVMDSDLTSGAASINETKKRVREEFEEGPGFSWLTQGREIENYVDPAILEKAVMAVNRNVRCLAQKSGRFRKALAYKDSKGERREGLDKVKVAKEVARHPANLKILDLQVMVKRMTKFIREANGLHT